MGLGDKINYLWWLLNSLLRCYHRIDCPIFTFGCCKVDKFWTEYLVWNLVGVWNLLRKSVGFQILQLGVQPLGLAAGQSDKWWLWLVIPHLSMVVPLLWTQARVGDRWGFEHLKVVIPTTWGRFLCQISTYPPLPSVKDHG